MAPDVLEAFAIRCALGNNGGEWAKHYTEEQREHWRQFIRDLAADIEREAYDRGYEEGDSYGMRNPHPDLVERKVRHEMGG